MAQERSIEVKVGILILVSLAILGGFILVMGGLSFQRTYTIYVDFDNPGGMQTGAAVRIAGVKVGTVTDLEFRGGDIDPEVNRRVLVRAKCAIEQRVRHSIRKDAEFYVTTQGVLGEQFMAIEPGTSPQELPENSKVKGVDPPRIDLFLAKAYELLDTTVTGIRNNREVLSDIATNTASLLKGLNELLTDNRERIDRIVENLEKLTQEANVLTHNARMQYVDNAKITQTIDNINDITTKVRSDSEPLLKDAREAMANLNRVSATVGDPQQQEKLRKILDDVSGIATKANQATTDAQAIVAHIKQGKGSVGAFVMDEELYDNVQEMVRDLKHNPWKFLWRE
jgi:phospholipid/cholesterol/gamma-HCH transport system substrate-binding protein